MNNVQYSLEQQLNELEQLGNNAGLYDAVDFLKNYREIIRKRIKPAAQHLTDYSVSTDVLKK